MMPSNTAQPSPNKTNATRESRRLLALKVLLACASLLFCLLAIEAAARVWYGMQKEDMETFRTYKRVLSKQNLTLIDMIRPVKNPRRIYELLPGQEGTWLESRPVRIEISSQGLRDREFTPTPSSDVFRIATIGDSICFGQGVAAEKTYSKVLERMLNQFDGTKRYEVMNFGVPGYNTVMEVETFREQVLDFHPDVIVLEYCPNDGDLPNFVRIRPNVWSPTQSFALRFLLEHMAAGNQEPGALEGRGELKRPPVIDWHFTYVPKEVPSAYRDMVGRESCREAIRELARLANNRDIPVVLTPAIIQYQILTDTGTSRDDPNYEWVLDLGEQLGFAIADPAPEALPFMRNHNLVDQDLWVGPEDAHPNPAHHALIAESIFRTLVEKDIVPDAKTWRGEMHDLLRKFDRTADAEMENWPLANGKP